MADTAVSPNNLLVAYRGRQQRERTKAMPWDAASFKARHNHSLSQPEAKKAAAQASAILATGAPEGVAIATANKRVNKMRRRGTISDAALAKAAKRYAEGGRPAPGKPAVVGEDGPELIVPDKPTTVVPKSLLGSLLRVIAPRDQRETEADRAKMGRSVIGNTLRAVAPRKSRFGQDEVQDVDAASR